MSLNVDDCALIKPDCDSNSIPIFNNCYPVSRTPSNKNYDIFKSTRQTGNLQNILGITDNLTLPECILTCKTNPSCGALSFLYNNKNSSLDFNTTGTCSIAQSYQTTGTQGINVGSGQCGDYYTRILNNTPSDSSIAITSSNGTALYIDSNSVEAQTAPVIESNYGGVNCRKFISSNNVDTDLYNDSLSDFADWCRNNQSIDTCVDFCNNVNYSKYCDWTLNVTVEKILLLFGIWLFILFLGIFLSVRYTGDRKVRVIAVFIVILLLFGSYIIYLVVIRNRKKTDYKSNIILPSTTCGTITGCNNVCQEFLGNCDCVNIK